MELLEILEISRNFVYAPGKIYNYQCNFRRSRDFFGPLHIEKSKGKQDQYDLAGCCMACHVKNLLGFKKCILDIFWVEVCYLQSRCLWLSAVVYNRRLHLRRVQRCQYSPARPSTRNLLYLPVSFVVLLPLQVIDPYTRWVKK